jgi:TRAP-type C4-dicarboxylate transport system permease small subunit
MVRRALDRVVDGAMIVAEVAIVLMMAHITLELLVRWVFRHGLDAVPEIVSFYYMTAVAFLSLAYVTRGDGHIAAQVFTDALSPRHREILEGVIAIALGAFMLLLTWQLVVEALTMTRIGEIHQGVGVNLPKWPGRWIMSVGAAIMTLYAFALGVRKLIGERPRREAASEEAPFEWYQ